MDISKITKENILDAKVFEYLLAGIKDASSRALELFKFQEKAKELGMLKKFNTIYKIKLQDKVQEFKNKGSNKTSFSDQPIELNCGSYKCDDFGVQKEVYDKQTLEVKMLEICCHPILISKRLLDLETGCEKVEISFYKDQRWQIITTEKSTVANFSKIINLSDLGVEVNSDNAKNLVSYFSTLISLNIDKIPIVNSVNHLGWIKDKFIPYSDNVFYDGDVNYKPVFEAIHTYGDYDLWKEMARKLRKNSKILHIFLAASFSATLLDKISASLCFIVELYGGTGIGKSFCLALAMSIFGNPANGLLFKSLNGTDTGLNNYNGFMKNLPIGLDELQTIKERDGNFDKLIYQLTQGVEKMKGNQYGGIKKQNSWKTCFLMTGEEPITKSDSLGGVKNRVIEIEVKNRVTDNFDEADSVFKNNYGYAGKDFIENLPSDEELNDRFVEIKKEVISKGYTDKQAMAVSIILLADEISTNLIFKDKKLTIEDLEPYLKTDADVDIGERVYNHIIDLISLNKNKFADDEYDVNYGDNWGKISDEFILINRGVLETELKKVGFDFISSLKALDKKGLIIKNSQGKYGHRTTIGNVKGNYIKVKALEEEAKDKNIMELPF